MITDPSTHADVAEYAATATTNALEEVLTTTDSEDCHSTVNVADGLFAIAQSIDGLTRAVRYLGNGDASTHFGALEAVSMQIKEGLDTIGGEVGGGLSLIAQAVETERSE